MSRALLFNGQPQAPELAWHRGFQYGDGIFRTCLIYLSQPLDIEEQIEKASHDARRLGLEPPSPELLAGEAARLAQDQPRAVLKLFLVRGGAGRGYRPATAAADRLWCRFEAPDYPAACWERGVHATRLPFRLASQPALAGVKHLNRLEQVMACREWPDGADEGLLADAAGRPACGTRTNLFWIAGDALRTPDLGECGVAGVMRDKVLRAAAAAGLRVEVAPGTWADLEAADEAFVTNSVVGIWPLARLDGRAWVAPGPATRRLMERLRHPRLVRA